MALKRQRVRFPPAPPLLCPGEYDKGQKYPDLYVNTALSGVVSSLIVPDNPPHGVGKSGNKISHNLLRSRSRRPPNQAGMATGPGFI